MQAFYLIDKPLAGMMGPSASEAVRLIPVSYTHLDVYKRQASGFGWAGRGAFSHSAKGFLESTARGSTGRAGRAPEGRGLYSFTGMRVRGSAEGRCARGASLAAGRRA